MSLDRIVRYLIRIIAYLAIEIHGQSISTTNTTIDQVFIITLLLGNELPPSLPNNLQTMQRQVFPSYVTCSQSLVVKYHHYLPLFAKLSFSRQLRALCVHWKCIACMHLIHYVPDYSSVCCCTTPHVLACQPASGKMQNSAYAHYVHEHLTKKWGSLSHSHPVTVVFVVFSVAKAPG